MGSSRREVLEGYLKAINDRDIDRMADFLTDDYVETYPQSGERVVGIANLRAMVENYPGGLEAARMDLAHARVVGEDEQWVLGPSFSVIHVSGVGDTYVATTLARYPDGSTWYVIGFADFRGDRISASTMYFAPVIPAPEWRAEWVERIDHVD